MTTDHDITEHYTRGNLRDRLNAALVEDGIDPRRPTIEALAPYDQFHGRGLAATEEMANQLEIRSTDHILDVGSGSAVPRATSRIASAAMSPVSTLPLNSATLLAN